MTSRQTLYNFHERSDEPLVVDFLAAGLQRRQKQFGKKALLAKAVGFKPGESLRLVDATAGFGEDAFLLASLGIEVLMLERSPIVAALLASALERAQQNESFKKLKLQLRCEDSLCYLQNLSARDYPDVIYLDPMYPARNKSALGKKKLRLLKKIVGEDVDADALFNLALLCARRRVVVKRPRLAPPLGGKKADLIFLGQSTRFDVYFLSLMR